MKLRPWGVALSFLGGLALGHAVGRRRRRRPKRVPIGEPPLHSNCLCTTGTHVVTRDELARHQKNSPLTPEERAYVQSTIDDLREWEGLRRGEEVDDE